MTSELLSHKIVQKNSLLIKIKWSAVPTFTWIKVGQCHNMLSNVFLKENSGICYTKEVCIFSMSTGKNVVKLCSIKVYIAVVNKGKNCIIIDLKTLNMLNPSLKLSVFLNFIFFLKIRKTCSY